MASLTEEFKARMDSRPDDYTLAWWNQKFAEQGKAVRGAVFAINRSIADLAECMKHFSDLRERFESLEQQQKAEREKDRAMIGKLQAELTSMGQRVDRMAEFLNQMKKNGQDNG